MITSVRTLIATFLLAACQPLEPTVEPTNEAFVSSSEGDVATACEIVQERYAYPERLSPGFAETCAITADFAEASGSTIMGLEIMIAAVGDNHMSLNVNTPSSPRLVPSGTDVMLSGSEGRYVVASVRARSGAAEALFMPDPDTMVVAINGNDITDFEGSINDLNRLVAGRRDVERSLSIIDPLMARRAQDDPVMTIDLGDPEPVYPGTPLTAERLNGNVAFIRFNNSLDDSMTVAAFDAAVDNLKDARGWIIDLRDTPGGGNTSVAEPILGRFVSRAKPYQLTVYPGRKAERRFATPRGPWTIDGPVIVIVGRWTGSMGEGMAVGFDGMGVATVIGTEMAQLRGGVEEFELPSGFVLRLPTYDLRHVDGTPRHEWVPPVFVTSDNGNGPDLALAKALELIGAGGN